MARRIVRELREAEDLLHDAFLEAWRALDLELAYFTVRRTRASWELPMPGLALVYFDGGPAYRAADCGFVRLAPGAHPRRYVARPQWSHVQPGDELVQRAASEHDVMCVMGMTSASMPREP